MKINMTVNLAPIRQRAIAELNNAVTGARQSFVTEIPGQEEMYAKKLQQAKNILDNEDMSDIELVFEEAKVRGIAPALLAKKIIAQNEAWQNIKAQIELLRVATQLAINTAMSEARINQALNDGVQKIRKLGEQ